MTNTKDLKTILDTPAEETHLISDNGERGPRIWVYRAMIERMLEYEDEVARGIRIPNYILEERRRAEATKQRRAQKRAKPQKEKTA